MTLRPTDSNKLGQALAIFVRAVFHVLIVECVAWGMPHSMSLPLRLLLLLRPFLLGLVFLLGLLGLLVFLLGLLLLQCPFLRLLWCLRRQTVMMNLLPPLRPLWIIRIAFE